MLFDDGDTNAYFTDDSTLRWLERERPATAPPLDSKAASADANAKAGKPELERAEKNGKPKQPAEAGSEAEAGLGAARAADMSIKIEPGCRVVLAPSKSSRRGSSYAGGEAAAGQQARGVLLTHGTKGWARRAAMPKNKKMGPPAPSPRLAPAAPAPPALPCLAPALPVQADRVLELSCLAKSCLVPRPCPCPSAPGSPVCRRR